MFGREWKFSTWQGLFSKVAWWSVSLGTSWSKRCADGSLFLLLVPLASMQNSHSRVILLWRMAAYVPWKNNGISTVGIKCRDNCLVVQARPVGLYGHWKNNRTFQYLRACPSTSCWSRTNPVILIVYICMYICIPKLVYKVYIYSLSLSTVKRGPCTLLLVTNVEFAVSHFLMNWLNFLCETRVSSS